MMLPTRVEDDVLTYVCAGHRDPRVAVTRMWQRDVADRAGVEVEYIGGSWASASSIQSTTAPLGGRRSSRPALPGLERAGLPIEAMVEAVERGELSFAFLDLPVWDRFSGLSRRSFREVSSQETIPLELLMVVREAIGFAQADPDNRMRGRAQGPADHQAAALEGVRSAVIERWLRVYGETLRRITEAESDWWFTKVQLPDTSGLNEAKMLELVNDWGEEFATLGEQALLAIYRAKQEHTWTANLIEEVEGALDRAGLQSRMATPPAICFLDISGYTRMTEELGDEAAAELATRLTPLVQRPSDRHGGKVVKWLGDGVMFHFREPAGAVVAALEMLEAI